MIVKIKFNDDLVMLFGDSYKTWQEQLTEYIDLYKLDNIIDVWHSDKKWISMGGLKWCSEEDFPKLLKERENRDINSIEFKESPDKMIDEIMNIINNRWWNKTRSDMNDKSKQSQKAALF